MIMMRKNLLFFVVFALILGACKKKEEECVAPGIEQNLVGSWTANYSGLQTGGPVDVKFEANGTMSGGFTALASAIAMKPLSNFKWAASANVVNVSGTDADANVVPIPLTVLKNTCNEVELSFTGLVTIKLTR